MPRARSSAVRRPQLVFLLLAMILAAAVSARAARDSVLQISSAWRTDPIRIDGNDEEWRGRTIPVDGQRLSVGFVNDAEAIYLCLVTKDRVLSTQIARQGLRVWLDPGSERSKKHVFGVHFPIDPHLAAKRDSGGRWPASGPDMGPAAQSAVGILGSHKNDAQRVPVEQAGGILASAVFHGDVLVYELKVPLQAAGRPYTIKVDPGGVLRLQLETPEWRGPLPPSRGPIGFGVAVAAPGGRGVVGYPTVDAAYLKPTDVKAVVRLASRQ